MTTSPTATDRMRIKTNVSTTATNNFLLHMSNDLLLELSSMLLVDAFESRLCFRRNAKGDSEREESTLALVLLFESVV